MNDKGMIAPYLASSLVNLFKPENKSQFKLTKDLSSTKMNDFKINESIPVTLYSNMLTFRDSNKSFKLDEDLLKTMTNYQFNAGHSNQQDRKIILEFAEEMKFDMKKIGRKSLRDSSIVELLKSRLSWQLEFPHYFYHLILMNYVRLKLLPQEKRAGNNSNIIKEENVAIIDKLLEYKSLTPSEHKKT